MSCAQLCADLDGSPRVVKYDSTTHGALPLSSAPFSKDETFDLTGVVCKSFGFEACDAGAPPKGRGSYRDDEAWFRAENNAEAKCAAKLAEAGYSA